jgi:hypothetical protein
VLGVRDEFVDSSDAALHARARLLCEAGSAVRGFVRFT